MKAFLFFLLSFCLAILMGQTLDPDDIQSAEQLLAQQRSKISGMSSPLGSKTYLQMMDLGMWEELTPLLANDTSEQAEVYFVKARYAWLKNEFAEADQWLGRIERTDTSRIPVELLRAQLEIEAWRLDSAEKICLRLLGNSPQEESVVLLMGKIFLLKKNYPKARALAEQVLHWNPDNAQAYLLKADAYFWQQKPEMAIEPLRKSLSLDPLNPDARFAYGYAIWRRVDATQLPDMAAQWDLALQVHPLHFLTHWHWGNGHTHLTFADYVDSDEDSIRQLLVPADSLFNRGESEKAIQLVLRVSEQFPQSVLPDLFLGSYTYMISQLDKSSAIFQRILSRKAHYGPAHNGLAAVIKQKRFQYLNRYDELEEQIALTSITDPENFQEVFPDIRYYPDPRVAKMIWHQLHTGVVYFPFLQQLGRQFVIPPLHQDLALAMKNPYFRGATTFDNRQWMDIRGVGTGATGIEYVERGAHLERNVLLHEYVHLFHLYAFTDAEMREVRKRYFHAMKQEITLDYYSANNEFEYFAQTFPAYFIPVKAHPLNHKSLNTQSDLQEKDPLMYAFIDQLVQKHRAYLAGDSLAMADTWAHLYLKLAEKARDAQEWEQAFSLMDAAYAWDSTYLPIYLSYATALAQTGDFVAADQWLADAQAINEAYAPIYLAYADGIQARFLTGRIQEAEAIRDQAKYFRKADALEEDIYIRAHINERFRAFYHSYCRIPEAIEVAEAYAVNAPTISTDLRKHQRRAQAFAYHLKGMMGYGEEVLPFFRTQSQQHPQDYPLLVQYAQVLYTLGQARQAVSILQPAYDLLQAANNPNPAIIQTLAQGYLLLEDSMEAMELILPFLEGHSPWTGDTSIWVNLLSNLQEIELAKNLVEQYTTPHHPHELGAYSYSIACLAAQRDSIQQSIKALQQTLVYNPYHWSARFQLISHYLDQGNKSRAVYVARQGMVLPLPPGPTWSARLDSILLAAE